MTRGSVELAHGELSREVIGAFYHVYNTLGYGLAESVYRKAIVIALEMRGVSVRREVPLHVTFEGRAVASTARISSSQPRSS
jgi:GxxExxY protein